MTSPVTYELKDSVATITMNDGKVNVMSIAMTSALNEALDRAAGDRAVVVLTGRPGRLLGGIRFEHAESGRRRGRTEDGHDGLRAGASDAVLSDADRRRVQRSRNRDGRLRVAGRRLQTRRRWTFQDWRERSRHRNDDAALRCRDVPLSSRADAFQSRRDVRGDVRADRSSDSRFSRSSCAGRPSCKAKRKSSPPL